MEKVRRLMNKTEVTHQQTKVIYQETEATHQETEVNIKTMRYSACRIS